MPSAVSTVNNGAGSTSSNADYAWRQFPFFQVDSVKDANDPENPPQIFKAVHEISTVTSTSAGVLVADIHGSIHALGPDFEPYMAWTAHTNGRVTHMAARAGKLVSLGEEDGVRSPILKIWDLDKLDHVTGTPALLRNVKVGNNNRPHPVTIIALSATLSALAIGLADGTVLLYRHLDQSLSSTSLTALPKPRTVTHETPGEPITGLGFREPSTVENEDPHLYLFIVTTTQTFLHLVRGSSSHASALDEVGSALGCAAIDSWQHKDMIIAREEAIYLLGIEGRGTCFAYEGRKSSINTHASYVVIVSPPFSPTAASASTTATVRNFVARTFASSGRTDDSDVTKVTVFDLENKLVACSHVLREGVREVVSAWGNIYVLGNDGSLFVMKELPTPEKLNLLFSRGLFKLALNLAKTQRLDAASVAEIRRQYGDHLYSRGEYDNAMSEFVQTIGHLQPSYVIRKFLDAQRIHNLTLYLQELHSLGLANADHTTLLLNTYTKLKDVDRLDAFIKNEAKRSTARDAIQRMQSGASALSLSSGKKDDLPFDLDTAIRVCRQAGYFSHAAWLAKKYERHEEYLRIQIEDAAGYSEALIYLRSLGEAAENNLARYSRALLEHLPDETTQLLIDLCTGPTLPSANGNSESTPKQPQPGPSYLSYLALNRNSVAGSPSPAAVSVNGTEQAPPVSATPSIRTVRPRGDSVSRTDSAVPDTPSSLVPGANVPSSPETPTAPKPPPPVKRLSPRVYFAHYVDHMDQFLVFLEEVAWRRWGQTVSSTPPSSPSQAGVPVMDEQADKADQIAVWNTLLELYLTLTSASKGKIKEEELREKAMRVLRSEEIPYDPMHALILCSSRSYTDGLILLWEKMGMYEEILQFWMTSTLPTASDNVILYLKKYGTKDEQKHLYVVVLRYLSSSQELLRKHEGDLKEIIEVIDKDGIMPPLGVVQILSRNGVASVGLVKEWLIGKIKQGRDEIAADKEWTSSYRMETSAKEKQVASLSDPEHPKVFHVTRCSRCSGPLDLPTVHFMCGHSYHQSRCIADHETECPNCAREHAVIREIRLNNERLADQHDVFISEVKEGGGFDAVANGFSRGIMNLPRADS